MNIAMPPSSVSLAAQDTMSRSAPIVGAGRLLLLLLEAGQVIDAKSLRDAMSQVFGGSDAQGAWRWKDASEAGECAQILFLLKYGARMQRQAGDPFLAMLKQVATLVPTQARRSGGQRDSGARPHSPDQSRNKRRCSGRWRRMSRARSGFCRPSRVVWTRLAPSPVGSARPAGRACSGLRTILRAATPAWRCGASSRTLPPAAPNFVRSSGSSS